MDLQLTTHEIARIISARTNGAGILSAFILHCNL
jgi:hypothetical protein